MGEGKGYTCTLCGKRKGKRGREAEGEKEEKERTYLVRRKGKGRKRRLTVVVRKLGVRGWKAMTDLPGCSKEKLTYRCY